MLYQGLLLLSERYQLFNLVHYLSFRVAGAVFTTLVISLVFGSPIISWLRGWQKKGQPIRENGPESHLLTKKGTPTMGGSIMFVGFGMATLLWADLTNPYIWMTLLVTMGYGALGFVDDYLKVTKRNTKGVPGKVKLLVQFLIALSVVLWLRAVTTPTLADQLVIPFFKDVLVNLGWFSVPFAMVVMVGASNAVNLTDGLDGLAIVPIMIAAACFALISYVVGDAILASHLELQKIEGVGELSVFCAGVIGAGLGFLWFNAPPAKVFMGDMGSLALGGALGTMAVITKHEIVLAIIGGLFVIEALSVIMQVYYYRFTGGKRLFAMAPIHHHFEKKGWPEVTVVIRFWIVAIVFALIGLTSLKLH